MRCRHALELISRALDETLGEYESSRLAAHLSDCTDCRRHQSVLQRGRELMHAGMVSPPENFEWKVQLGIQRALRQRAAQQESTRQERAPFWRPLLISASAVAVVVLAVGSLWIFPGGGGSKSGAGARLTLERGAPALAEAPEPDLRRAVRHPDFDIDVTDDRFGIRTVGGGAVLERGGWHPSSTPRTSAWGWHPGSTPGVETGPQLRGLWVPLRSIDRLQLLRQRSRLPQTTTDAADSMPREAAPR